MPPHIDRRGEMLESSDQGNTPQCVAFAVAGCIEWWRWKALGIREQVDPVPIYKRAKEIDGAPQEDGTTLEAGIQAAVELGLIPIDMTSLKRVYQTDVQRAIHQHGVALGAFNITEGWGKAKADGWILDLGGTALGGHAVVLSGYSNAEQPNWIGLQNSWGDKDYGWRGFCRMKPDQFRNEFMYGLVWEVVK